MKTKKKHRPFIVRPWSIGECPTGEEVHQAWTNRKRSSADFVKLLSVLGELNCFLDCRLVHKGGFGNIAGRAGGLKAFLEAEVPELAVRYKSISRYATLATRLKRAFAIYPPAALSLMHPDLPLQTRNMPFLTNHCRKVFRDHFAKLPPTYVAYNAAVTRRLKSHPPKLAWGQSLPQSEWAAAEQYWRWHFVRPSALARIRAEHRFFPRDWNTLIGGESDGD